MTKKRKIFIWGLVNFNWSLDINAGNMIRAIDKDKYKVYTMVTYKEPYEKIPGVTYLTRYYPDRIWLWISLVRAFLICRVTLIYRLGEFRQYWWLCKLFRVKTAHVLGITSTIFMDDYPRLTSLHALSETMRKECESLGIPVKEKILTNPIRTEPFQEIRMVREKLTDAIFIGHDFERKGVYDLFYVAKKVPDIHFHIVGGYPEHLNKFNQVIEEESLHDRFTLHGPQKQESLLKIIDTCQLHLLPSRKEGRPKAAIEAAAAGLPSILYEGYGAEEYLEDGANGYIVSNKEEMVEKVILMIKDSSAFREMSENTEKLYKKFDLREIAKEYEELIDTL